MLPRVEYHSVEVSTDFTVFASCVIQGGVGLTSRLRGGNFEYGDGIPGELIHNESPLNIIYCP